MRVKIDHSSIEVLQGDITQQETDAIVNAANNHLWMGGGVAGAIKRKGGEGIEEEAMAQGPIEIGAAVLTGSGTLKAKHVIHAVVMGQDLHADETKIKAATRSALALAESKQLASIAFPALGTGIGSFSVFHCAKIMLTEAIEFLMRSKHLHHVLFILFDKPTFDAFEEEMKLQFSAKRH